MKKRQIFQILGLLAFLYLGIYLLISGVGLGMHLFDYEYNYANYFFLITILLISAIYIIYSQKDYKFVAYLRLFLSLTILAIVFNRLALYSSFYYDYNLSFTNTFLWGKIIETIFSFFINPSMILAVLVSGVLLLNKPPKSQVIKIGRIRINF